MDCLFGFFDILGYKSFCENSDDAKATEVLALIDGFKGNMLNVLSMGFTAKPELIERIIKPIRWLTFSDTIFLALPIPRDISDEDRFQQLTVFVSTCIVINGQMFGYGLPVRGVIHRGTVLMSNTGFAGNGIVAAAELEKQLEAAVTVVTDTATEYILSTTPDSSQFSNVLKKVLVSYDVPEKTLHGALPKHSLFNTVNWVSFLPAFINFNDIQGSVSRCFLAHGKQMDEKTRIKAANTERLFHYWLDPRSHAIARMKQ